MNESLELMSAGDVPPPEWMKECLRRALGADSIWMKECLRRALGADGIFSLARYGDTIEATVARRIPVGHIVVEFTVDPDGAHLIGRPHRSYLGT